MIIKLDAVTKKNCFDNLSKITTCSDKGENFDTQYGDHKITDNGLMKREVT